MSEQTTLITKEDDERNNIIGGIAVDRLRSLIERVERLEEEKAGIASDIRDIFAEAKGAGFDSKIGISIENNYLNNATPDILSVIDLAIIQKMNKNRKRKWEKTEDGRFHHI